MKNTRRFLYLPLSVILLGFAGCKKQVDNSNSTETAAVIAAYTDDEEADATYTDVYNSVSGVNEDIAIAETDVGADTQPTDPLGSHCYTITINPATAGVFPKTVTIDFGAGCLCKDGK